MKQIIIFLLLTTFFVGCGQINCGKNEKRWETLPIYLKPLAQQRSVDDDLINTFNKVYGKTVFILDNGHYDISTEFKALPVGTNGQFEKSTNTVYIRETLNFQSFSINGSRNYKYIVAHELGHALGYFDHSASTQGLMYKDLTNLSLVSALCQDTDFNDWMAATYGLYPSTAVCSQYTN